jgi:hypothetical protein
VTAAPDQPQAVEQVADFACAICGTVVSNRWRFGREREFAPVCRYCEGYYTMRVGKPQAGSFRDRREAMRLMALAEALHGAAGAKAWSDRHAA